MSIADPFGLAWDLVFCESLIGQFSKVIECKIGMLEVMVDDEPLLASWMSARFASAFFIEDVPILPCENLAIDDCWSRSAVFQNNHSRIWSVETDCADFAICPIQFHFLRTTVL